jgi:hypothetical protein
MVIRKEITKNNEFYLWMNGKIIYKKWLNNGASKIFDLTAYDKYTYTSITDFDLEETPRLIIVKAEIKMRTTDEGGRKTGFKSGYRPNHVFEYEDGIVANTYIGDIQFEDQESIMPGEEKIVNVRFLAHQPIEKHLNIGQKWWIHEGPLCIGEAEILEIIELADN